MKKSIWLVIFIVVPLIAGTTFGQLAKKGNLAKKNYGLLFPTFSDGIHENITIPLSYEEAKHLMKNPGDVKHYLKKTASIVDTLKIPLPEIQGYPYFGGEAGDSMAVFFSPGAGCKILKVGFNVGYNGNNSATPLNDGVNVSLHFVNYNGEAEAGGADIYLLGEWLNGVWTPTDWYKSNYPNPPIGASFWGDFPVTPIADPADAWEEVDMSWGSPGDADCLGEDFVVMFAPYGGDADAALGWEDLQNWNPPAPYRIWKFYSPNFEDTPAYRNKWFCRLQVSFACYCIVEFYENTPPALTGRPYSAALTSDARTLECFATDVDGSNDANAGVKTANLFYKANEGDFSSVTMTLTAGTITDGTWAGVVPTGVMTPGDTLTFYFEMTDGGGLTAKSLAYSYRYFKKAADILFYYNDYTQNYLPEYYMMQAPHSYDVWDGIVDGPDLAGVLELHNYDYIIRVDGYGPQNLTSEAMQNWLATGTAEAPKCLFWSSQDFLGYETIWTDTTYEATDWHNMYLGIGGVKHDLQWASLGYSTDYPVYPWPINAVMNDPISGALAKFAADSSWQLMHDMLNEFVNYEWSDGIELGVNAVACFTDLASGMPMGLHKETATTKSVYLAFDQLALNFNGPYTDTNPDYVWPEYGYPIGGLSIVVPTLEWFGAPTAVDQIESGIAKEYKLNQNYPNPFNPETEINYGIAKAGMVTLSVYNVLGQKVAELVNKQLAPGNYRTTWNASDLSSGVYFYRLEAGDYTRTLKMMLLR